jgi:hypothetical protein
LGPYGRLVGAVVVGCAAAGTNADGADYGSSCSVGWTGEELATNVVGGHFRRACRLCWFDGSCVLLPRGRRKLGSLL